VVKLQVVVVVVKISQQEGVEAMTAVVEEEVEEVDEGEEDLVVAKSSLQRTFLHRFLPVYRQPIFSNLLLDSNHCQPGLTGHYVLASVL
jgi:hypothetical protein